MCKNTPQKKAAGAGKNFTLFFCVILHFNFKCVVLLLRHIFLIISQPWITRLLLSPLYPKLVSNHAVVEVPFVPHVVNPLSVSIQSVGKKRLILDLRHVNQFIWKQKFKCEDWRMLLSCVNKGDYLFSFDLTSDYHHFDIFPDHQTFWGFSWVFFGSVRFFLFFSSPIWS